MAEEFIFHHFVNFDFESRMMITHNENGFTAAYDYKNTIIIWKNNEHGPNLSEGRLISIIIDQFPSIDQLQWVQFTNDLLIRTGDRLILWDIFTNSEKQSFLTTDPIFYAKVISLGLLIVKTNGKFSLYTKESEITSQITSDLILDIPEGILVYPTIFYVEEGEWLESEVSMSIGNRFLRRRLESANNIQINGDLIQIGEDEIEELTFPEGYQHLLNDIGLLVVSMIGEYYLLSGKHQSFLLTSGENQQVVHIMDNMQLMPSNIDHYYIIRSALSDARIVLKEGSLIKENIDQDLHQADIRLDHTPPSFFIDNHQDLRYARFNEKYGLLWFPDYREDYVFFDLFAQTGSIFSNIGRQRNTYILVNKQATHILEWQRGEHYPSGTLRLWDILDPDSPPQIIYDVDLATKRIDEDEFLEGELADIDFPMILPSWNKIELWGYTTEPLFSHEISYSQYYLMLDHLSQSDNAEILEYPSSIPEKIAFIFFGNLHLSVREKNISFENIYPEWTFHAESGLLAYFTIDEYCYVINTFDPHLLPIYSFSANFPYIIKILHHGKYLLYLSFDLRETTFSTHPQDGYADTITTLFPYLVIDIHNLSTQKSKRRSVRFPVSLSYDGINIVEEDHQIFVFYPSYSDNSEESVVMFDFQTNEFHIASGTAHFRLWMTHSKNSPYSRIDKGDEFPLLDHPEISRDHVMRPFQLYEGVLVRKQDQIAISMADINLKQVNQQSTADMYDLDGTVPLQLPFYYTETMKSIHINKADIGKLKLKDFVELSPLDTNLQIQQFTLEKIPRNNILKQKMADFIRHELEHHILHTNRGIAFEHPDFAELQEETISFVRESGLDL